MPYHRNDELLSRAEELVTQSSVDASMVEIGKTVEGRSIMAVDLSGRGVDGERPRVFITGNVHGQEVIGSEVALGALELLCAEELAESAKSLLDIADVTVIPAVNLDSRSIAVNDFLDGKTRGKAPRGNANGVDLNRNFPFPKEAKDVWYPLSGTTIAWLPWYRGPEPLSEPETLALAELAEKTRPVAGINFHSVGRFFLYPYCYSHKEPADLTIFKAMGEAYLSAQPRQAYRIRQSRSWYAILGDLDDFFYDYFGTLSVTVEVSTPLAGVKWNPVRLLNPFCYMNPLDPAPTVVNNAEACLVALTEAVRVREAECA